MLHALQPPYDKYLRMRQKDLLMPTEREHSQYNDLGHDTSKFKSDSAPSFRLRFLDTATSLYQYPLAWLTPTGCLMCTATRYVFTLLALYG